MVAFVDQRREEEGGEKMITSFRLQYAFTVLLLCVSCFAEDEPSTTTKNWNVVFSPFRPVNIAAQGATIWVCGVDEMILRSSDGGATWETKHQNLNGEVLLDISFVNEKIGHAAGTGGLLLSTDVAVKPGRATSRPALYAPSPSGTP